MLILISRSHQKCHNSEHSNFVVELKIKFFNVHEFPIVQEFQKKQKSKKHKIYFWKMFVIGKF